MISPYENGPPPYALRRTGMIGFAILSQFANSYLLFAGIWLRFYCLLVSRREQACLFRGIHKQRTISFCFNSSYGMGKPIPYGCSRQQRGIFTGQPTTKSWRFWSPSLFCLRQNRDDMLRNTFTIR